MVIFHELLGLKNMEKKRWNIVIQWWFIGISLALSWWRLARELMMVDGKHHYSTTLYLDIKPIHVGWNPLSDAYFMGIYTSIYLHIFPSDPTYSNSRTIHGHGQTPFRSTAMPGALGATRLWRLPLRPWFGHSRSAAEVWEDLDSPLCHWNRCITHQHDMGWLSILKLVGGFRHEFYFPFHRRKFRSQTSDNMDWWKAEQGRGREKRQIRREKIRSERVRRKKMQMREKVGKSRNTVFFQWFVAPEGRKVGSLKRRVRSQLARWEMKKCTLLWREAHFEVKMYKTHQLRTTFGSWDVEKAHAVVARSTFRSQNVQNTLSCRTTFGSWDVEKAHAVVARSTFRSQNVQNTLSCRTTFGSWDVEKVHAVVVRSTFPSQNVQNTTVRATFGGSDVEKVHAVVARSTLRSQNVQNTTCPRHFWRFGCRKSARRCGAKHISKSKCTKHHMFAPLLEVRMSKKCTPLWREAHFEVKMYKTHQVRTTFGGSDVASLQDTTLQDITLQYTTVQYTPLH